MKHTKLSEIHKKLNEQIKTEIDFEYLEKLEKNKTLFEKLYFTSNNVFIKLSYFVNTLKINSILLWLYNIICNIIYTSLFACKLASNKLYIKYYKKENTEIKFYDYISIFASIFIVILIYKCIMFIIYYIYKLLLISLFITCVIIMFYISSTQKN